MISHSESPKGYLTQWSHIPLVGDIGGQVVDKMVLENCIGCANVLAIWLRTSFYKRLERLRHQNVGKVNSNV